MTCAGRSRSRSLALLVSARTCCTWSSGKVLAITPRLMWSLRRMPAGRPEGARAIVAARPRESASMIQLRHYVNSIDLSRQLGERVAASEEQAEAAIARYAQLVQEQRRQAPSAELERLSSWRGGPRARGGRGSGWGLWSATRP